jgi:quercetin dioxygenase-like cupin family protein
VRGRKGNLGPSGRLVKKANQVLRVVLSFRSEARETSGSEKAILIWEEVMPTLVGFGRFAALLEEQISEKISRRILSGDQGMIVWWSIGAGVHVEPHSHANEQIAWMLKGKMEFRLGSEQRVCGPGDVMVIPGGTEHEAWFREDTEVIDFFAPPRDDFLAGGKPAYMSEG